MKARRTIAIILTLIMTLTIFSALAASRPTDPPDPVRPPVTRPPVTKPPVTKEPPPPVTPEPKHEHDWGPWILGFPGNCIKRARWYSVCSLCGETRYKDEEYGDHDWGEWHVVKEPTTTEWGLEECICNIEPSHRMTKDLPPIEPEVPEHSANLVVSWQDGIGEGRRYEGAEIPLFFTLSNTGLIPIRAEWYSSYQDLDAPNGITDSHCLLNPGEAMKWTFLYHVSAEEASIGLVHPAHCNTWYEVYLFSDGKEEYTDGARSNPVNIPLTYPEGYEEEKTEPNPLLILTDLGDKNGSGAYYPASQDTFEATDGVYADHAVTVGGNVPLHVIGRFSCSSFGDVEYDLGYSEPGHNMPGIWGWSPIGDVVTPMTETDDLMGTIAFELYFVGLDVNTGDELCKSGTMTRLWKVRKPGPTIWETPAGSDIEAKHIVSPGFESADPSGYQLGENYATELWTYNTGIVPIPADTITIHDPYSGKTETAFPFDFDVSDYTWKIWNNGVITEQNVSDGGIYYPPIQYSWTDPDNGEKKTKESNELFLPTISKTGLLLKKGIAKQPDNKHYFVENEEIEWTLTVTNNSKEPVRNVKVFDQGILVGSFAEIGPGGTETCTVPKHTVTKYEAEVTGSVSNIAYATGTDILNAEHTWWSNLVTADTGTDDPIFGVITGAEITKAVVSSPANGKYYELGEKVEFSITVKNTGEMPLENVTVTDSLNGFTPIGTIPLLSPDEEKIFSFIWTVTEEDVAKGCVRNSAVASWYIMGFADIPIQSNEVYVPAGENWWMARIGEKGTIRLNAEDDYCKLELETLNTAEAQYSLHACGKHYDAAREAEKASAPGTAEAWKQAGEIWREAVDEEYETLMEAGDAAAKAALLKDRTIFYSYLENYTALTAASDPVAAQKAAAEMLRFRCTELCCMMHTAPDALPDSLTGGYAKSAGGTASEKFIREIGPLQGADSKVTERYDAHCADVLRDTMSILNAAKESERTKAFIRCQQIWQIALDEVVNAEYLAADADGKKLIAASRIMLDKMYEARKEILEILYNSAPGVSAEILMNLYRNAATDARSR